MAAKVRLVDGREITIPLSGKRVFEMLSSSDAGQFARFTTTTNTRIWIRPSQVSAIEDRPDLD
jgi:hypothetical protein